MAARIFLVSALALAAATVFFVGKALQQPDKPAPPRLSANGGEAPEPGVSAPGPRRPFAANNAPTVVADAAPVGRGTSSAKSGSSQPTSSMTASTAASSPSSAAGTGAGSSVDAKAARAQPSAVLGETIDTAVGALRRRDGTPSNYGRVSGPRALALCIDWEASTPRKLAILAFGSNVRIGLAADKRGSGAVMRCQSRRPPQATCSCVLAHTDGRSVLVPPDAWLERHLR